MALNRYTTSSRFSPKTTDPITGARVADPEKEGKVNPSGGTKITSWPEFRKMYKEGKLPSDVLTGTTDLPSEITEYMEGRTDKLAEKYAEPEININPDTQEYAHYKAPSAKDFKAGDSYTSNPDDEGKIFASWMRLDAEEKANESEVARRRRKNKSQFGDDVSIQGDTKGGIYTKEQLAGLYPDMQFAGGVSMSDFSQGSYVKSKAQLKEERRKKDEEIKIAKDLQNFEEGTNISRLPVGPARGKTYKAVTKGGIPQIKPIKKKKMEIVGKTEEYVEPKKPGGAKVYTEKKFKGKRIKGTPRVRQKFVERHLIGAGEKRKYKKEGKLAKATYSAGLESLSREQLDAKEAALRSERKDFLGAFGRSGFKALSAAIESGKDIRDVKKAKKYRRTTMGEGGQAMEGDINRKGSTKYFTPTVMKNYRSSLDNAVNRNESSKFFKR